jgi:hypothetical protein
MIGGSLTETPEGATAEFSWHASDPILRNELALERSPPLRLDGETQFRTVNRKFRYIPKSWAV